MTRAARRPSGAEAAALARFRDALDGAEPAGLESLSASQLAFLADAVTRARRHHAEELRAATTTALGHVPKLLRGPVRRIVGI